MDKLKLTYDLAFTYICGQRVLDYLSPIRMTVFFVIFARYGIGQSLICLGYKLYEVLVGL